MKNGTRVYWDSSCFITLLNRESEPIKHEICTQILNLARNEEIELWTSCWTMAETIRPSEQFTVAPLPIWAKHLDEVDKEGQALYPGARGQLEQIWEFWHRRHRQAQPLSQENAQKLKNMFAWKWIKKIQVGPLVASRAAEIARETLIKPGDALHVASAVWRECSVLHCWDRDFKKTEHLIPYAEPKLMVGPLFEAKEAEAEQV